MLKVFGCLVAQFVECVVCFYIPFALFVCLVGSLFVHLFEFVWLFVQFV